MFMTPHLGPAEPALAFPLAALAILAGFALLVSC